MSTKQIDRLAMDMADYYKAIPGFKGYKGYPYAVCTSVNNHILHGFPSDIKLKEGDIVSIDYGILKGGYYGDAAITIPIGNISSENKRLLNVTEECLHKGIERALSGNRVGDISNAIQEHAEANGYSVVKEFVGHAIGRNLHELPQVPNYGKKNRGPLLKAGMVLAIEPILLEGKDSRVTRENNGWTVRSVSGAMSAHFEHTIVITENTPNILSVE